MSLPSPLSPSIFFSPRHQISHLDCRCPLILIVALYQGRTPGVISPLALEAVRRIDALFEIERSINGQSAERRRAVRQEVSAPLVAELEGWMREQRAKLSRGNDLARAIDYMLKRWPAFTRFLDDGRMSLEQCGGASAARHCDEAFIVPLSFKCL